MDTSIWIALISASGLITTSSIQWMSNRVTVKAAAAREVTLQEKSERERQLERDHALALARQEREDELARTNAERKIAVTDRWLDKRDSAYIAAITAANAVLSEAGRCLSPITVRNSEELLKANSDFVNAVNLFMEDTGRVEVYGSETAGESMADFVNAALIHGSHLSAIQEKLHNGEELTANEPTTVLRMQRNLTEKFEKFRRSAKADLGTLD